MQRWKELELATERTLKVYGYKFLRIDNYRCFRCGQVQNSRAANFPDFFVYYPKIFAVECKTGKGKLTKGQAETREHMESAGIHYIELRDVVDELINYLETIKK